MYHFSFWGFLAGAFLLLTQGWAIEVYVSPTGDDNGLGTIGAPFKSLHRARDAVRAWRAGGGTGTATVWLREGRHQLDSTLVLTMVDGAPGAGPGNTEMHGAGTATTPHLIFSAYNGENAVVSAGVPFEGWTELTDYPSALPSEARGNVWVADLPEQLGLFHTLFDGEGRLKRAQTDGFNPTQSGDKKTLHFPGDELKNWSNLEDVEILVRPRNPWTINMLPLASVDEGSNTATTTVSATYDMSPLVGWAHNPLGVSIWAENVLEGLDEPGEWVVNTQTGKVYLWPRSGGAPTGILAPTVTEMVRVEGVIDYEGATDTPVRGIAFVGLTFTHGDRKNWTNDEDRLGWGLQHDWEMFDRPTAMMRFRGAEDCLVLKCRFEHSGGTGLRMDLHSQRIRVVDSEFGWLGAAGILMAGYGLGTKDLNRNNEILNNHVHDFGEIIWHSAGIWAWQSGHNRIAHNHVHHSAYSAILVTTRTRPNRGPTSESGMTIRRHEIPITDYTESYDHWQEREAYMHSRHNLIEYNEISHSVQKLSDGNGIYISGAGRGNIARYNFLHDNDDVTVTETIRCDDDQHETLIYGNILARSDGFSVIAIKGINDIVNNFIVNPSDDVNRGYVSFEAYRVTDSKIHRNIIVAHPSGGRPYGETDLGKSDDGLPDIESTDMDSNLYYHPNNSGWVDSHLSNMRSRGKEENSRFGNPLFVDPGNDDYAFQSSSPALDIGIEPLDVALMGRQTDLSVGIGEVIARPAERVRLWGEGNGLRVLLPAPGPGVLRVYSLSGKLYRTVALGAGTGHFVPLEGLPTGWFLARVSTGGREQAVPFHLRGL